MTGACATCRRKSRRCGRERPACSSCLAKGDECEGYPLKFCGLASRGRLSGKQYPTVDERREPRAVRRRQRVSSKTQREEASTVPELELGQISPQLVTRANRDASPVAVVQGDSGANAYACYSTPGGSSISYDAGSVMGEKRPGLSHYHSTQLTNETSKVSPLSANRLARDDELLRPLDTISGIPILQGQRFIRGMTIHSITGTTSIAEEERPPAPIATQVRRLSWATRLAAVRLEALPSLSGDHDEGIQSQTLNPERVCFLLEYFDETVCPKLVVGTSATWSNPFQQYLLPLVLQFSGVLYAVLGLSVGHLAINHSDTQDNEQESLQYRFRAIRQVIKWLELGSSADDACLVEAGLAVILILVLHDVCETGVSAEGIHLDGVMSICQRHSQLLTLTVRERPCMQFLLGALSWLHMLRCVSGDYKLMLPSVSWKELAHNASPRLFECFSGCPIELFVLFVRLLELSRNPPFTTGQRYHDEISAIRQVLLSWEPQMHSDDYPPDTSQEHLANAFRHSFLLHSVRMADKYSPSSSSHIQCHVNEILDSAAQIPSGAAASRRLLWPIFIAGTESVVLHQHDYIRKRIREVRNDTGFRNLASTVILDRVWKEKMKGNKELNGCRLWTDIVSQKDQAKKHDYLVF